MFDLKKIAPATYLLEQKEKMRVPGLIIGTEDLFLESDIEKPLEQVKNVACLKGIVGYSIAMPDMHWGYGFAIGGVAAMDAKTGLISPGGVGYDINCGVRLAIVPEPFSHLQEKIKKELIKRVYSFVPSGVGQGQKGGKALGEKDYSQLLTLGAKWSIEQGFGLKEDLEHMESYGQIADADPSLVSSSAKSRGKNQLGTIGSGNHFVEIGEVEHLFLPEIAHLWGIEKGLTYVLIHSGSRGLGHQVCQDALSSFIRQGYDKDLPDKQLIAAPIESLAGQEYLHAMAAAANFAFNNRQQILHEVRTAFHEVMGIAHEKIKLIYDVCHNIAKFETHRVEGKPKRLCVHRKGATRAFGPGAEELNPLFRQTGQPVLVPGDMGRASYLMVGLGNPLTWCSCCHGAGRARSRIKSMDVWKGRDPVEHMKKQGVTVLAASHRTIAEEMPDAYKNIDSVVAAVKEAGLANPVARLKPHLVIKG